MGIVRCEKSVAVSSQAYECMDALMFNLRQEHVVICDFKSTFHQVTHDCPFTEAPVTLLSLSWPCHKCHCHHCKLYVALDRAL